MRPDFVKLLTERGKYHKRKNRTQERRLKSRAMSGFVTDEDDDYAGEPIRAKMRNLRCSRADFNDFLSPLWNFLQRSVGRKWDEVWSEICKIAPTWTTQGDHLREHTRQYVTMPGDPFRGRYWGPRDLFVDDSGVLKRREDDGRKWYKNSDNEKVFRPKFLEIQEQPFHFRHIQKKRTRHFHLRNGVWYEVTAEIPKTLIYERKGQVFAMVEQKDVFINSISERMTVRKYKGLEMRLSEWFPELSDEYGVQRVCTSKKTCSRKDLKLIRKAINKVNNNEFNPRLKVTAYK